jgi:hypothetical protein
MKFLMEKKCRRFASLVPLFFKCSIILSQDWVFTHPVFLLHFLGPSYQASPILTLMQCTKASYSIDLFILHLNCGISIAHQALSDQIDAMTYVSW